jgi:Tfp pilus assembly protein PilF
VPSLNPADLTSVNAFNNTGNCYAVLKQYDKALEFYQRVLNINPNNKDAIRNMAVTYTNTGNTAKAQEYNSRLQSIP